MEDTKNEYETDNETDESPLLEQSDAESGLVEDISLRQSHNDYFYRVSNQSAWQNFINLSFYFIFQFQLPIVPLSSLILSIFTYF